MSGDERDNPLSDELRGLLDAARPLDAVPDAVAGRILRGVDRRAALSAEPPPDHRGLLRRVLTNRAVMALGSFALGAVAGTLIERARHPVTPPPPPPVVAPPVIVRPPVVPPADVPTPPTAPTAPTAPVVQPAPAPAAPTDAGRRARGERGGDDDDDDDEIAAEGAMIDIARGALRSGRPADALDALRDHARRYPRGQLAPEREALKVRSLAALGRADEARRAAERFLRRYPDSTLRDSVESALRGLDGAR